MANLLRTVLLGGLVWVLTGCQAAMFSTFNAITPSRGVEVRPDLVFDRAHDLRADVFLPRERNAATPVVVFFYGGSWRNGSKSWYRFIGERLASHGLITVIPDYRQYPQVRFPVFIEDAARAVVWARAEYAANGRPLFVAGHSAGAHIAALVATDGAYLKNAGGSIDQLAGMVGYSGVYDFLPLTDDVLKATFGGEQRLWDASQPINHVDGDEPPFFLVHGRNDGIVWPRNSESLARALRSNGVPVNLLLRDKLGHYASAINFARRDDDEITQALLAFLRDPPPRGARTVHGG
ncbi:MAG: alpha/beta hydrolase [Lysobacterales bacterium]